MEWGDVVLGILGLGGGRFTYRALPSVNFVRTAVSDGESEKADRVRREDDASETAIVSC